MQDPYDATARRDFCGPFFSVSLPCFSPYSAPLHTCQRGYQPQPKYIRPQRQTQKQASA